MVQFPPIKNRRTGKVTTFRRQPGVNELIAAAGSNKHEVDITIAILEPLVNNNGYSGVADPNCPTVAAFAKTSQDASFAKMVLKALAAYGVRIDQELLDTMKKFRDEELEDRIINAIAGEEDLTKIFQILVKYLAVMVHGAIRLGGESEDPVERIVKDFRNQMERLDYDQQ